MALAARAVQARVSGVTRRAARGAAVRAMASAVPTATIVGANGRVGDALAKMGPGDDLLLFRGDAVPADAPAGPILVCTRNDVLDSIVDSTPEDRRGDLVFLQNGMLQPWLDSRGLSDATQCLVYFAVAKKGEPATDGITDLAPDGLTAVCGKHADAVAARFHGGGLACHVMGPEEFKVCMLEKLIWISAFMLVGARNGGCTVGEVESEHKEEVCQLISELAAGTAAAEGVEFGAQLEERLCAYGRSVAHFPTAVKEFEWRNGYFYGITKAAGTDPFPTHTKGLVEVGAVEAVSA
eukprot:CAMPEP_0183789298 /NCGR_PEP_ID=MMETSP0803_2-20130417/337_1 /TAXON_ID=195967 /ORGANISM="Crustomastix stigmata, Strain CCMP3273" /LENGTH=294 /DNA_ID=CAMNT_0026033465 /DNA_START=50 /DNA_END=934 /DNA_ORIENTATION=+